MQDYQCGHLVYITFFFLNNLSICPQSYYLISDTFWVCFHRFKNLWCSYQCTLRPNRILHHVEHKLSVIEDGTHTLYLQISKSYANCCSQMFTKNSKRCFFLASYSCFYGLTNQSTVIYFWNSITKVTMQYF